MDAPTFIGVNTSKKIFGLSNYTNVEIKIEGKVNSANETKIVREYEYYKSTITVSNTEFRNNYAFKSTSFSCGYGGSIFVSESSLLVQNNSIFDSNLASIGGAICCLQSAAYIRDLNDNAFSGNVAYKYGGAIYFCGFAKSKSIKNINKNVLTIKNDVAFILLESNSTKNCYNFKNNKSGGLGGAICLSLCSIASFENCYFFNNSVENNGGAISSSASNIECLHCIFNENMATTKNDLYTSGGGGAIYFSDNFCKDYENKKPESVEKKLSTEGCCFIGNEAKYGIKFNGGMGHDIFLEGFVKWSSYLDAGNFSNLSVYISNHDEIIPKINYIDFNNDKAVCGGLVEIDSGNNFRFITPGGSIVYNTEADSLSEAEKLAARTRRIRVIFIISILSTLLFFGIVGIVVFIYRRNNESDIYSNTNNYSDSSTNCAFVIKNKGNILYESDDENATLSVFVVENEIEHIDFADINKEVFDAFEA